MVISYNSSLSLLLSHKNLHAVCMMLTSVFLVEFVCVLGTIILNFLVLKNAHGIILKG